MKIIRYFFSLISKVLPVKTAVSFFGCGFLPHWQTHWAALSAILLNALIVEFSVGWSAPLISIATVLALVSISLYLVGLVSIWLYSFRDDSEYDSIVINSAAGQLFVFAFAASAILEIKYFLTRSMDYLCKYFVACSPWFYDYFLTFVTMMIPYFAFRIFEYFKIWPIDYLENRNESSAFTIMTSSIISAFYCSLLLYMISLILLNLELHIAITFMSNLFANISAYFVYIINYIEWILTGKTYILDNALHSWGVYHLFDDWGIFEFFGMDSPVHHMNFDGDPSSMDDLMSDDNLAWDSEEID